MMMRFPVKLLRCIVVLRRGDGRRLPAGGVEVVYADEHAVAYEVYAGSGYLTQMSGPLFVGRAATVRRAP
jgi:hypothetical protein